jgi:hypothetical protein
MSQKWRLTLSALPAGILGESISGSCSEGGLTGVSDRFERTVLTLKLYACISLFSPEMLRRVYRLQVSIPASKISTLRDSCSRWEELSDDSAAILLTRLGDIVMTYAGENTSSKPWMSSFSTARIAMLSIVDFIATLNVVSRGI